MHKSLLEQQDILREAWVIIDRHKETPDAETCKKSLDYYIDKINTIITGNTYQT